MAGYDPKAKRAHSPAAEDKAPVDDLLGASDDEAAADVDDVELYETFGADAQPTAASVAEEKAAAPKPVAPAEPIAPVTAPPRPATSPPPGASPAPKVLAAVAAVVAVLAIWRWRRR